MLLEKFFRFSVLPRTAVRNYPSALRDLLHKKLVRRVSKKGRVFYELTEKSLPLLEDYRHILLYRTKLHAQLTPHARFYQALLGDLRFLNDRHPLAKDYQFLGDWQLVRAVVPSQLELAKLRYYETQRLQ